MKPQTNPYIEAATEEQRKQNNLNTRRHKFSVHGLYMEGKPIQEKLYDVARIYCKENHIEFILRDFYSGMPEDCEYVERLPAFHIYYEDEWAMTFYEGNELESRLQQIIEEVKIEKKKKWFQFTFPSLLTIPTLPTLPTFRRSRSSRRTRAIASSAGPTTTAN